MLLRVVVDGILMAAQDIDCVAADTQPRSGYESLDRWHPAQRCRLTPAPSVPISRSAVKPAIRSSRAARTARMVRCGTDSSTVCRSSAPGMQEQMNMRINQARQQRVVAEIDQLGAGRMLYAAAHRHDAIAFYEDFTWGD